MVDDQTVTYEVNNIVYRMSTDTGAVESVLEGYLVRFISEVGGDLFIEVFDEDRNAHLLWLKEDGTQIIVDELPKQKRQ